MVKEYCKDQFYLFKLKLIKKSSEHLSDLIYLLILLMFLFFFVLFISISAAFALGQWLDSQMAGFAIVSGFYLVILIFLISTGKTLLKRSVQNKVIKNIFKNEPEQTH